MDEAGMTYYEGFCVLAWKFKKLIVKYITSMLIVTAIMDKKVQIRNNEVSDRLIKENTENINIHKLNRQFNNALDSLDKNELSTKFKGTFFVFSMVPQELNTAQELEQEYFSEIAKLFGFKTIKNTKCTSVDEIIEALHNYNANVDSHDACFALALTVHEKDARFTEGGGMKQIFDELLTLRIPKDVPKLVFIESFRGGNYETEQGSINNSILSYEMKNTFVAYSTINNKIFGQNRIYCSKFTKIFLDEVKKSGFNTEIHKLLTRVNKSLSEDKSTRFKQFSSFRSSLTTELYFKKF